MSELVRIKHLENPNITTFVNGKQINIRNFEASVELEDAKAMMQGSFGYELIGVYDNFLEYVNKIEILITNFGTSAPFEKVILATPLAGQKLYSWNQYTEKLLNLELRENIHIVLTIDEPSSSWKDEVFLWAKENESKFAGISIIEWDSDKNQAWNRVFKITVGRQLIFNFVRTLSDVTHIWFVDSDTLPPSFALKRLLSHNRDHVAGFYRFKSVIAGGPVIFNGRGDVNWPPTCLGDQVTQLDTPDNLIECDWTGAGCLLLSKKIYETFNFDWNKWIQRNGEDAWICLYAQKLTGRKLLVDLTVNCQHIDELGEVW